MRGPAVGGLKSIAACAITLVTAGCEPSVPAEPLALIDSIVLDDAKPDAAINRPSRIYLGANGEFMIGDFVSATVIRFGKSGEFLNVIGRAGEGPGEFRSPAMIAAYDTVILVFDGLRRNAQLFRPNGEFLDSVFAVPFLAEDIAVDSQSVWATGVSFESSWSALRWSRRDGSTQWSIEKPSLWVELPVLGALGGAHAAFGNGTTWMTFSGIDQVVRWRGDLNVPPDTFSVPKRVRRGVPMDRVRAGDVKGLADLFSWASGTADLSVLPGGGVAILYKDLLVEGQARSGTYYVTVLDSLGAPACVDIPVPIPPGTAPVTRLKADTLVVLEQMIPDSGDVTAVVRRWRIGAGQCAVSM